jgi:hypothetical protein
VPVKQFFPAKNITVICSRTEKVSRTTKSCVEDNGTAILEERAAKAEAYRTHLLNLPEEQERKKEEKKAKALAKRSEDKRPMLTRRRGVIPFQVRRNHSYRRQC